MVMFVVGLLSWWYGAGWVQRLAMLQERIASTYDYFSIDILVRTLFSPYRQISAGRVRGPIAVQLRAFADRMLSRMIGAIVRTLMIVIGCIALALTVIIGSIGIVAWGVVPLLPVVGVALSITGWMPWLN